MAEEIAGGDLSRLRQLNSLTMVRVLRAGEPATLTELAARAGLSRASTEDVVGALVAQGWVAEVPPVAGAMGRPARRYRFRGDAGHVLGVDIGGHRVRALVTDLDGTVLGRAQTAVAETAGRATRLAAADSVVSEGLRAAGLPAGELWAVGVASSGLVDPGGRVVLSVAIPEWTGLDLAQHFGTTFRGPVVVDNDSRLAALAEQWRGVARYAKDFVHLLAGLRTGVGLVIDGKLHRGFGGAAGEIGALPNVGWIRAQEHLQAWDGEAADLFAAARAGDRSALGAVRRYVRDLSVGTAALVLALDPQMVVLGGGFSRSADVLLEPLRKELDKHCIRTPEVLASTLGEESVALGAVKLALDHVQPQLVP
ncbi:ROK family transcriptional regulator [Cryptosporangium arvum]|uniref:Transcriptional regulator/sugar kinase n=1 Tax=Cryptosporangium arvum DSM 44712 TaxID=927661 RepID=A0A011AHX2_9ACTN|nr:ROK family protein [Cryptosporangium arvum]EXG81611.1 transcriptional regulator/sugar kinase [Cryptosporangium arvum DSM 44712]